MSDGGNLTGRQICISAKECRPTRGRAFAIGDRVMFRCEWWTVVGLFFAPKAQTIEKIYILQSVDDGAADSRRTA